MGRIRRFIRSTYVTPLSKSINSRHLALEPLCCIQSCKVRSGCSAVGIFESIAIGCILAYSISKLIKVFSLSKDYRYSNVHSYADFSDHPAPYVVILITCLAWIISVAFFILGVRKFNARLVQSHIVVQLITLIISLIILIAVAVQIGLHKPESAADAPSTQWDHSSTPSNVTNTPITKTKWMPEQIGLLTCSLYVITVQIWGVSVAYDCYKYFKLCQVLVQLGSTKKSPTTAPETSAEVGGGIQMAGGGVQTGGGGVQVAGLNLPDPGNKSALLNSGVPGIVEGKSMVSVVS